MSKHDEKVKVLLEELEKKKAALGKKPSQVLVTNGILKFSDNSHININTINDIDSAVKSLACVLGFSRTHEEASKILGVETGEFTYSGYSVADWSTDLKYRVDVIKWNAKQAELNALSKKLEALVSEDLKTEKALSEIENLLK